METKDNMAKDTVEVELVTTPIYTCSLDTDEGEQDMVVDVEVIPEEEVEFHKREIAKLKSSIRNCERKLKRAENRVGNLLGMVHTLTTSNEALIHMLDRQLEADYEYETNTGTGDAEEKDCDEGENS